MYQKFTQKELYKLRNFIPINDLIRKLSIPFKFSEGHFRFLWCARIRLVHLAG